MVSGSIDGERSSGSSSGTPSWSSLEKVEVNVDRGQGPTLAV